MVVDINLIPDEAEDVKPLFGSEEEYERFAQKFIELVTPLQDEFLEARRRSEEEARLRYLD
jgi:hypothetical protein